MYLIPKNIKVKRSIFNNGFGMIEIVLIGISMLIGYVLSLLVTSFKMKVLLFSCIPLLVILCLLPLPNGSTIYKILFKFFCYSKSQKQFKKYP